MAYTAKTRLFIEDSLPGSGLIDLDKGQTHYLANVMRVTEGTRINLFNGRDGEWQCLVTHASRKSVSLLVEEKVRDQKTEPDVWLVFAPIKKARIDFMAQKATELGASKLIPLLTARTNTDRVKVDRLALNAIEAAEQCERLNVPEVTEPIKFKTLMEEWPSERRIMFCDEMRNAESAIHALPKGSPPPPWAIFIGPEGGFDDRERETLAAQEGCVSVSLGPRILRADTAAMAALSLWQATLGDW
ncbi:16S rRNA (uracil(1498)-N(3))-methyltransferase [Temperatibacter marinus]|uniref:Ribosomal RNA small subunit methyltransferase E n=1 Tax=Temperatibacter marinus TaxID=1456591 RepID=A0AA52H9P4_9PROT|nr:16S rRNA (uracil(1498)-N(3))-methyltransferase [Temperatibacter marinus]WND03129.1 16S rRNA (uracil(1498)-N(3))-methyltransferase [Temperatibacter marinus]